MKDNQFYIRAKEISSPNYIQFIQFSGIAILFEGTLERI